MEKLKPWFMAPYMMLSLAAVLHSLFKLIFQLDFLWIAPLIATAPLLVLMAWFFRAGVARSSRNLPWLLAPALAGGVLSLFAAPAVGGTSGLLLLFYGVVVGAGGASLYVFWYSRLSRAANSPLRVGETMPAVHFRNMQGEEVSSRDFDGSPAIWLFYRGNWCPLCMAQIREVAEQYRELEARGVRVILVSPQPESQSRDLAKQYSVNLEFLADPDGRAAKALGIYHVGGLPRGMGMEKRGYQPDTVLPTVVITDGAGAIIWADQTDNYRVRPEPATFMEVIDSHLKASEASTAAVSP